MKRLYIKLKDDTIINVPADTIDHSDGWFRGWKLETVVAYAWEDDVVFCYLSEQKE